MRAFIVTCLFSLALAAPQGYSYQSGGQLQLPAIPGLSSISGNSQQLATIDEQRIVQEALQAPKLQQVLSGETQTIYQQPQQQIYHQQQQQQQQHQQHLQLPTNFAYNLLGQQQQLQPQQQQLQPQQQQLQPQQQQFQPQQQQFQPQQQQLQPQQQQQLQQQSYNPHTGASLVSKDIYVHVPPVDDSEERYPQPQFPQPPPRKHYRIVFIKAPTVSASKTALRIKQAPVEEKTIIYVLTKKPDPLELQTAIEEAQAPKQISKPEVFFIKYKTQEEAVHAQRTIQAQYDQLGGTTQVSDEGVAPVTSVIGVLDNQRANIAVANTNTNANGNANANVFGGLTGAIPTKYLPAHLRA